jgi:Ca-activated chloride channel family protein
MTGSPRRVITTAAVMLLMASVSVTRAQSPATFRAAVSQVTLNVVVRDTHGRAISGLTGDDFQVLDTGLLARLTDFHSSNQPISLTILFDTSGSMRLGARLLAARQVVGSLLDQLQSGVDEAALLSFDSQLHTLAGFSTDFDEARQSLQTIRPFGSTSLHDAIAEAARLAVQRSSFHRAVVVVTDGVDTSSSMTASAASAVASAIDVPVYLLAVRGTSAVSDSAELAMESVQGGMEVRLDHLARWTGGALLPAATPAQMSASVQEIVGDLRSSYVMAFAPSVAPGWHPLTVQVARKGATVRTRPGFWMSAPASLTH